MFAGKARSLPNIGGSERHFTRVDSNLNKNHYTWLKRLVQYLLVRKGAYPKFAGSERYFIPVGSNLNNNH